MPIHWSDEIDEILAKVEVSDLIASLQPWIEEVSDPTEEGERALERLFESVLANHPPAKATWFAFVVGQAWERAVTPKDAYRSLNELPTSVLAQELERRGKEMQEGEG